MASNALPTPTSLTSIYPKQSPPKYEQLNIENIKVIPKLKLNLLKLTKLYDWVTQ